MDNGIRKLEQADRVKATAYGKKIMAEAIKWAPRISKEYKDVVVDPFDPKVIALVFVGEFHDAVDNTLETFGNNKAELVPSGRYDNKTAWSDVRETIAKLVEVMSKKFVEALYACVGKTTTVCKDK